MFILLGLVVAVSLAAGCSTPVASSAPTAAPASAAPASAAPADTTAASEPMELVVGTATESMGLDPEQMPGFGFDVDMLYEPLIAANADQTDYVPALCSSVSYSEDGKTITFKIPDGLTFSNGDKLDANAVKASFERMIKISMLKHLYLIIQKVEAPDAQTVVVTCSQQPSAMMSVIASPLSAIMDAAVATAKGDQAFMTSAVGYGPYTVKEWNRGNYMLLEANKNFKTNNSLVENKGPFHFDTVKIRYIPSPFTRVSELQAGNVDLIFDVPTDSVASLKADKNLTVLQTKTTALFYAAINSKRITDVNVRTALNLATNRDQIVEALGGAGAATYGPLLSNWVGGTQAVEDKFKAAFAFNLEKAKSLLAAAGYTDADGDGILDKDGKPLKLTMYITTGQEDVQTAATMMQQQFKAAGVSLDIKTVDQASAMATAQAGDYDLFIWSCGWSDANIFTYTFTQEVFQMMADSPDYQKLQQLTQEADFNNDIKVRQTKYAAAADLVLNYVPMISLYNPTSFMAYNNKITGLKDVNGVLYLNDAKKVK
jgi:peptide/nickel transport system substrate-binding protein